MSKNANARSVWPQDWGIPSEERMRQVLVDSHLLIRVDDELHVIDPASIPDIYNTDIGNQPSVKWNKEVVRGLKVRHAFYGRVPRAGRWAGDFKVSVEDVFANVDGDLEKKGTFVEVQQKMVKITEEEGIGAVWRPIFIVYEREREVVKTLRSQRSTSCRPVRAKTLKRDEV
jgi:hypothetical protein